MLGIDAKICDVPESGRLVNIEAHSSRLVNSGTGISVSAHLVIKAKKYYLFYQLLNRL